MKRENVRPRLLIVGPMPPPYIGPAVATERLVHSPVMADAFDVTLLNIGDPDGLEDIGRFTMHNVSEALGLGFKSLGILIRRRPRAIYVPIDRAFWGFLRDLLFLIPARLLGVKVIIHLRAGRFDLRHDFGRLGRSLAWIGLKTASRSIVLGETVRDVFGPYAREDRLAVVPNGIDLDQWPTPVPAPSQDRDALHIVYLANLFRDKGAHVMLGALSKIREHLPGVRVSFAGKWMDKNYQAECLALVEEQNLGEHVQFLGVVGGEDKKKLLRSADVVAFVPVKPEGSPWVVLEAMATGRPVIGTPQGTMKEVIVDGETGYLIEPENSEALADRIKQLADSPELRRQLGDSGRQRVEKIYNEIECHRKLADVILDALGERAR